MAKPGKKLSVNGKAIQKLFDRPWFQRVWEVVAARNLLFKCGTTEIDAPAFFSGLIALNMPYGVYPGIHSLMILISCFDKAATFRLKGATSRSGVCSVKLYPLAELLDMFHLRQATERCDKVYALLGMSSDEHLMVDLSPNYEIPWGELFRQVINVVLKPIAVCTWDNSEIAVIRCKGNVLGQVIAAQGEISRQGTQKINIIWNNDSGRRGLRSHWVVHASAKPVRTGDFIFLAYGVLKPTIIRLYDGCWMIIKVAGALPDDLKPTSSNTDLQVSQLVANPQSEFLLMWIWEADAAQTLHVQEYGSPMGAQSLQGRDTDLEIILERVASLWNIGQVLQNMGRREAGKYLRMAMEVFDKALRDIGGFALKNPKFNSQKNGGPEKIQKLTVQLLNENSARMIRLAAEYGYEALVKLLLENTDLDPDVKDEDGRTPLSWAVRNRHGAIVKLLLFTGKVDPEVRDSGGRTLLSLAAENGDEAIAKLLLGTGRVDPNAKDRACECVDLFLVKEKQGKKRIWKMELQIIAGYKDEYIRN
ncbi:het [Fusarium sp. NRRL 52700]|nr:het [Fusarium sp. NRRL 52700]